VVVPQKRVGAKPRAEPLSIPSKDEIRESGLSTLVVAVKDGGLFDSWLKQQEWWSPQGKLAGVLGTTVGRR
jgi:hypothetical protein